MAEITQYPSYCRHKDCTFELGNKYIDFCPTHAPLYNNMSNEEIDNICSEWEYANPVQQ